MPDSSSVPVCFKDISDLTEDEKKNIREDVFSQYPQTPFVQFSDMNATRLLFEKIVSQPQPSALVQKGLLIELIDMLISDNFPEAFSSDENLRYSIEEHVKEYLDAGQGLTSNLDNIARQFNYSKYHLERLFKARYGISLISYRNNKRLQLAKEMLQIDSVSSVSGKLGFSSIYVFSRAFKNHFGYPPSDSKQ